MSILLLVVALGLSFLFVRKRVAGNAAGFMQERKVEVVEESRAVAA
jgi:hypothetical protein